MTYCFVAFIRVCFFSVNQSLRWVQGWLWTVIAQFAQCTGQKVSRRNCAHITDNCLRKSASEHHPSKQFFFRLCAFLWDAVREHLQCCWTMWLWVSSSCVDSDLQNVSSLCVLIFCWNSGRKILCREQWTSNQWYPNGP